MITFVQIVIGLLLFGIIFLKIILSIQTGVSNSTQNLTGDANASWNAVMTPLSTMWDKVIVFAFITATLLLFVSAFFIDTHPVWVILYIISNFILVLFLSNILGIVDYIFESSSFATEQSMLPYLDSLRSHSMAWLIGIMVLGGIIIYGKFSMSNNQPSGGGFR